MDRYGGLTKEHFEIVLERYHQFQDNLNDISKEPTRVLNPLSKRALDELALIREVSKELQKKKEEDVQKAAQAAEEAKAAAENKSEEKQDAEEEKTETTN